MEAPKGGGPKISRFFFPSSRRNFLSSLSWGPLVEFWWCLKHRGPEMCTFGVLGLSCASPGGPERNFGLSGGGLSGGGLSGGGLSGGGLSGGGLSSGGLSSGGLSSGGLSSGGFRVHGSGSGFWGQKQKQNKKNEE